MSAGPQDQRHRRTRVEICAECETTRDAPGPKVECLMCGAKGHPANMCKIPESVEGGCAEYYCQGCRWGL